MTPLKFALLAWLYAMLIYSVGVKYGDAAGWALFFSGSLAAIVFCAFTLLDDRPGQVERLEARDQSGRPADRDLDLDERPAGRRRAPRRSEARA